MKQNSFELSFPNYEISYGLYTYLYCGPLVHVRAKSSFLITGPYGNFSRIYLKADSKNKVFNSFSQTIKGHMVCAAIVIDLIYYRSLFYNLFF